jgi:hypothetical protein
MQNPHQRLTFALLAVTFAAMTAFNVAFGAMYGVPIRHRSGAAPAI